MNNLEVKTLNITPATIEFNHKQIKEELEKSLEHYQALVFTDESAGDIRKVLAEIRKGKTALDSYRKKVKGKLNEPVTEFEGKVKDLIKQFDDTINPLNEQLKQIVEAEKEKKREEIEAVKIGIVHAKDLTESQAEELTIHDDMLTKSRGLNDIKQTLEFRADNIIAEAEQQESNKLLIEQSVKLANAENGFSFASDPYIRLLEFQSVKEVSATIAEHVEKELKAAQKAIAELEEVVEEVEPVEIIEDVPFTPAENDLPFGDVEITHEVLYRIKATAEQLRFIENNFNLHEIEWEDATNE